MFLLVEKSAPVLITNEVIATQLWYADPCPSPFTDVPQRSGLDDCTQINICNVYRFSPFSDRSVKLFFGAATGQVRRLRRCFRRMPTVATSLVLFGGGAREGVGRGSAWGCSAALSRHKAAPTEKMRSPVGAALRRDGPQSGPGGITWRSQFQPRHPATGCTHTPPTGALCHYPESRPAPASALGDRSGWSVAAGQSSTHR